MAVESATFKNEVRGQEGGEEGYGCKGRRQKIYIKKTPRWGSGVFGGQRQAIVTVVTGSEGSEGSRAGSAVRSVLT